MVMDTQKAKRRSKYSAECAELRGWSSDDPRTWDDEQHAVFRQFIAKKDAERSHKHYEKDKANGKKKCAKKKTNAQMNKDAARTRAKVKALRAEASRLGLRYPDSYTPQPLRNLLKTRLSDDAIRAIERKAIAALETKANPYTPKAADENGVRKPGPAKKEDQGEDPETLRKRAMGRESSKRSYVKCKALYEEASKYEAMPSLSDYKGDINKLRGVLRKYLSDDEINRIEEATVQEYDKSIQDQTVPRKESRSATLLDQFFDKHPDIARVSKVEFLSAHHRREYNAFLDEKNPERVERRLEVSRRQEAKPETYFIRIRNEALYKAKPFAISMGDALGLIDDPCFYCKDAFEGLGIDAVNHSEGFVLGNIKSCCTPCNKMKSDYHIDDFVRVMCNIGARQLNVADWVPAYKDENSVSYDQLRRRAAEKNRQWEICEGEFDKITSLPCNYCGFSRKRVGLDRKDNDVHYTLDNVVPCCCTCNRMKGERGYDEFVAKAIRIYSAWGNKV